MRKGGGRVVNVGDVVIVLKQQKTHGPGQCTAASSIQLPRNNNMVMLFSSFLPSCIIQTVCLFIAFPYLCALTTDIIHQATSHNLDVMLFSKLCFLLNEE